MSQDTCLINQISPSVSYVSKVYPLASLFSLLETDSIAKILKTSKLKCFENFEISKITLKLTLISSQNLCETSEFPWPFPIACALDIFYLIRRATQ